MKKLNICVVVTGCTIKEFLKNFKEAQKVSELLEIRMDYIEHVSFMQLKEIFKIKNSIVKVIVTCRSIKHGGRFEGGILEQQNILQVANDLGFEYVDIDIKLINEIEIKNKRCKIICSYHNFEITPNYHKLSYIIDYMREFEEVDICKTATLVTKLEDNKVIYKVIKNKKKLGNIIILGMGELGKETRINGLIEGNYLTFASCGEKQTALGQIDIEEMKELLRVCYNK